MKTNKEVKLKIKKYFNKAVRHSPLSNAEIQEAILFGYNLAVQEALDQVIGHCIGGTLQGVVLREDLEDLYIEDIG